MTTPDNALTIGVIINGDEILSGKREDRHFHKAREILAARGLCLSWASYLGDDRRRCTEALRQSFQSNDLVFSFGGIGATPDDHTRQAAAEALGRPLGLHPQAADLIAQRTAEAGQPLTPERLRMGEFPQGASIVPNPYNKIPGFSVDRHYFLPGFPVMAWPMMEWVLDTHYSSHFCLAAEVDRSMIVFQLYEAAVTQLLEELNADYPELRVYSLPSAPNPQDPNSRRHLELGLKQPAASASIADAAQRFDRAYGRLRSGVQSLGGEIGDERCASR